MFEPCLLLAFGFGNLAMLGWLAAAAAPLLIHLWSRHRFREAPWAAMQFLLAAMRKNARRMQLQQWLLLAIRTLIIALVVLAMAEPYDERLMAHTGTAPAHKILVLDGSYSMAYRSGASNLFARAQQLAADLVLASDYADVFTVILMANPPRTVVGPEAVDHELVVTQLESLSQSHSGADLRIVLSQIDEALSGEKSRPTSLDRQEVFFFTDLQATTWASRSEEQGGEGSNLAARLAAIADRAAITVIDLGPPRAANLAVTRLVTPAPFVAPGRGIAFDATLRQFGDRPREKCVVECLVDDVAVGEQTVDVPAGGDATVRFTHRFNSPGSHVVAVRAPSDELEVDNERWLVVPVRDEVRVLCIAGKEGAARYVADALNPNPAGDSPIRPVVASEADLADLELDDFDCMFVCNVAQFTAAEAERLRHYAANGGGIVFFLGDRVLPDAYNTLADVHADNNPQSAIRNPQSPSSLLPARLSELITKPQFGLDPLDYRHPIVAPFRGRERAGLLTTPVTRYYRLEVPPDRAGVEIAAALPGGDPFIVTESLGRGVVAMVATDGSLTSVDTVTGEPWTIWPTWPSFLPIVRELLAHAVAGSQDALQQLVGMPLTDSPSAQSAGTPVGETLKIMRPDGRSGAVSWQIGPDGTQWSYDKTDVSGIYTLSSSIVANGPAQQFAVNVDTVESDLTKASSKELPREIVVRDTWNGADHSNTAAVVAAGDWSQSLTWAAFGLLLVESFLAWHFGRGVA